MYHSQWIFKYICTHENTIWMRIKNASVAAAPKGTCYSEACRCRGEDPWQILLLGLAAPMPRCACESLLCGAQQQVAFFFASRAASCSCVRLPLSPHGPVLPCWLALMFHVYRQACSLQEGPASDSSVMPPVESGWGSHVLKCVIVINSFLLYVVVRAWHCFLKKPMSRWIMSSVAFTSEE